MFQYTREFIINSNKSDVKRGPLTGVKFAVANDTFLIERMANIRKEDIVSAHKHNYQSANPEVVDLTLSGVASAADKIVRLVITIEKEGQVTALVNDQYPIHKKQYFYEGKSGASGALPVAAWVSQANKEAAMEAEDRLILVESSGATNLKVSGLDCYTRIADIRIVEVNSGIITPITAGSTLTGLDDYTVLVHWAKGLNPLVGCTASVQFGTEGAGTVTRILKNMRLLSDAHLDPYGLQRDERPLPNGQYDQYTIECVSERRHIGSQVFGAIDKSLTTYVFFVEQSIPGTSGNTTSKDFETALTSVLPTGVTLCGVQPVVDAAETVANAQARAAETKTDVTATAKHAASSTKTATAE